MFEEKNEDLIEYFFRFMISKEHIADFLKNKSLETDIKKSTSMVNGARILRESRTVKISLENIRSFARSKWSPPNSNEYLADLKSGLLNGHSWHGAMPSFLHLSFQKKVREYCAGKLSLNEYLKIGSDIVKHELFIVITHDLCEDMIIREFEEVIPSIANKGVSDFVFQGIPYDLKVSGLPEGWSEESAKNNPLDFVKSLYEGADTERLRKNAQNSINDWGLNRFYVIVSDPDRWLTDPCALLADLKDACKKLKEPISFKIDGLRVLCQLVFV